MIHKYAEIFSAKNIRILYIESAKTVNEMTLNELVKALDNFVWSMASAEERWKENMIQLFKITAMNFVLKCI